MDTEATNSRLLRRYLLDSATDDERVAIEQRFMSDDDAFDQMVAVEDELFFEYRQDDMTSAERSVFERKFLADAAGRDRLGFTDALIGQTAALAAKPATVAQPAKTGWRESIAAFFAIGSAMQAATAVAAIVLTIGVIALLLQNSGMRKEMAGLRERTAAEQLDRERQIADKQRQQALIEEQLAAEREKSGAADARVRELEAERQRLENEINDVRRRAERSPAEQIPGGSRTIASLMLSPGMMTRDGGPGMSRVTLPRAAGSLALTLSIKKPEDYLRYNVTVSAIDTGITVWTSNGINASGGKLNLRVPTAKLSQADYEVTVTGSTRSATTEEVDRYYFSVIKPK